MSSLSQDHDLAADAATVSERSAPSPAGQAPKPGYDATMSLGERLHASYREALGHQDGERSNFPRLPAGDQAFWNRAAVNFVARLSS